MKGEVARRQRVLRVRHVQHAMAAVETARARERTERGTQSIARSSSMIAPLIRAIA